MSDKTIRIWNGPKVLALLSVSDTGSAFSGATGGAASSIVVDIEIDPFRGVIVDHDTSNPPQFYREDSDVDRGVQAGARQALLVMLESVDSWAETSKQNHEAMGHRDVDCCNSFLPGDIRQMVKDAASELHIQLPESSA